MQNWHAKFRFPNNTGPFTSRSRSVLELHLLNDPKSIGCENDVHVLKTIELASSIRLKHACFKANLFKTEKVCFTWLSHMKEGSHQFSYINAHKTNLHQCINYIDACHILFSQC